MTHVCEMQNEVNPYIVQSIWPFGPKADPKTAERLNKTKAENRERLTNLAARKSRLKQLKKTRQAQVQNEKINGKNKALDQKIKQIDKQIAALEKQTVVNGQPEQQPRIPEHRRLENGP